MSFNRFSYLVTSSHWLFKNFALCAFWQVTLSLKSKGCFSLKWTYLWQTKRVVLPGASCFVRAIVTQYTKRRHKTISTILVPDHLKYLWVCSHIKATPLKLVIFLLFCAFFHQLKKIVKQDWKNKLGERHFSMRIRPVWVHAGCR